MPFCNCGIETTSTGRECYDGAEEDDGDEKVEKRGETRPAEERERRVPHGHRLPPIDGRCVHALNPQAGHKLIDVPVWVGLGCRLEE